MNALRQLGEVIKANPLLIAAGGVVAVGALALLLVGGDADLDGKQTGEGFDTVDTSDISIAGSWNVAYADRILGTVSGTAVIPEEEDRVTVRLVHPKSGARHTLRSTEFSRDSGTLHITLKGETPSATKFIDRAPGQYLDTGEGKPDQRLGAGKVSITMADASTKISAEEPEQSSEQEIKLELDISERSLSGSWRQWVIPETGRDENGRGRIGQVTYLNDGSGRAKQSGWESWSRPKPLIRLVVPHADQYARSLSGDAAYPYPYKKDGSLVFPYAHRRYLLVIGDDLPTELGEKAEFASDNPGVRYVLEARPSQFDIQPNAESKVQRGFARIEQDLRRQALATSPNGKLSGSQRQAIARTMKELRDMDFVLVRAELEPGAAPGKTGMTLNGARGTWSLRYGDYAGVLTFTRPLPAGPDEAAISEPVDYGFTPDKVYLEIRTTNNLPFKTLPVELWVNDKVHKFQGSRELIAARLPTTEADREHLAYRKRRIKAAGGDPKQAKLTYIYRTPALALIPAGMAAADAGNIPGVTGDYKLSLKTGDRLRAVFASPDKLRVTPSPAELHIFSSPAEVAKISLGPDADNNLTWKRAIAAAAKCARQDIVREKDENGQPTGPYDWHATARLKAETFTNTIILQLERAKLDMVIGDHAAMLMLRDVFIEMMTQQQRNLEALDSPAELAAFHQHAKVAVSRVPNHPLAEIDVTAPDGSSLPYDFTYADADFLVGKYGITDANIAQWRRRATASLIRQYLEQVRRSRQLAVDIEPCEEPEELVELTGKGFDGVYRYALGRLVTLRPGFDKTEEYWKPDLAARAWLLGVPTFARALEAQQAYSSADTRAIVTATAIATSAVSIGGGLLAAGVNLVGAAEATGALGSLAYSAAVLSEVAPALAIIADVGSAAYTLADLGGRKVDALNEVAFARGAATTIGMSRLDRAIELDPSYVNLAMELSIELGALTLGTALSIDDIFRSVARWGKPSSLSPLTRNITEGGIRTVLQEEAVQRGKALLGETPTEAALQNAKGTFRISEPPKISTREFADAFPDGRQMQGLNELDAADLTETNVVNIRKPGKPKVDSLDDVRALPPEQRLDVFAAMVDSRRIAATVGEEALSAAERLANRLVDEVVTPLKPRWAKALDDATYDLLKPMARRADVRGFAVAYPQEVSAIARDPDGLIALSRKPYNDIAELQKEFAKEQKRIKRPLDGFYEQTSPKRWDPDDVVLKDEVYNMRDFDPDLPDVQRSSTKIMVNGDEVGTFDRELEFFDLPDGGQGKQVVFSYADGKYAPRFIKDVDVALVPGRGAPLATWMNVRAFQNLNIPFADPSIRRIKMSTVVNANTSIEVAWMRRVYGDKASEFFKNTHSVRYAESALNQAGYRIQGVRIGDAPTTGIARKMVKSPFFNAVEDGPAFLARYGIDPDASIETAFDIYIDIEPF